PDETDETPLPAIGDGPIVFDDVTFLHDADGEAACHGVRSLSVSVAPGEFVGISGASGAGKTTFADLLVGLHMPQRGGITVAGTALAGAALKAWRNRVSYVAQDPVLFHDTVRRNLGWANPRASEAEMWQALTLADAEALVRGMAHGLDTIVGERGTLVSGGERQRLALARALLRQPRLLILDEATSAIDVAGERAILRRLQARAPLLTVIIIAHRSESLALCSRVLRFAGGRVVEDTAAAVEAAQ
ncbi:MAG TPA: ATP-binding cassette domain-containing protein, partial [Pseudolabrys sp.]|nr:ATP-binding cassette domain-containing protein [Pseudolabrys sp.]